jgi:peptide-methionine (S)-S-oxide reductase
VISSSKIGSRFSFLSALLVGLLFGCNRPVTIRDFAGPAEAHAATSSEQQAVFAGGCFWGVDAVFKRVKGVTKVVSGYAGGDASTANYEEVSTGTTGHAESVEVTYDPAVVSYPQLLKVFFFVAHDPTELNRQGPDSGTNYRSVIFYENDAQKKVANDYIAQLTKENAFPKPIVTQVVPLTHFYPAESYHQNYFELHPDNPYIVFNDWPKVNELKDKLPDLYQPYPAATAQR